MELRCGVNHEIYNYFQSYLIFCLEQSLRITFHKKLSQIKIYIIFVSTFLIHLNLHPAFALPLPLSPCQFTTSAIRPPPLMVEHGDSLLRG